MAIPTLRAQIDQLIKEWSIRARFATVDYAEALADCTRELAALRASLDVPQPANDRIVLRALDYYSDTGAPWQRLNEHIEEAADLARQLRADVPPAPETTALLRVAVEAFLSKWPSVEAAINSMFGLQFARSGQQYTGPNIGKEVEQLRVALADVPLVSPPPATLGSYTACVHGWLAPDHGFASCPQCFAPPAPPEQP